MSELSQVLELLQPDTERLQVGKDRMIAVWEGSQPDRIPVILGGGGIKERESFPKYDLREQFYSKEKMLTEHVWGMIGQSRAGGDGQLAMRANMGTGFLGSIFGLEQQVFPDKMPWLTNHLTKEEILTFEFPDDLRDAPTVARALDYIAYFREHLSGKAHVYLSDTQGPFDIAHLVYGHGIFLEFYDDPEFVHYLMRLATRAYIEATTLMKEATGEGLCEGYHGAIYMAGGGVRCCEDSSTLLPPELFEEFVAPYISEALSPFGGGWVHFCGNGHHLLDRYLRIPEVKGINFGNPERYDYDSTMMKILQAGKFYYGPFPLREGESVKEYFARIFQPLHEYRTGMIFAPDAAVYSEIPDRRSVEKLWEAVHN